MITVFYGGTFDPIHNAHLGTARELIRCKAADQVLFVPAAVLPHTYKSNTGITPFSDRMEMVRLAIADEPDFYCSDIEIHRPGRSYTIDTLRELDAMKIYGKLKLFIGSDSLARLHTWDRVHELIREFGLLIYPRPDTPVDTINLSAYWDAEETAKIRSSILSDMLQYPDSSTQIRELVKKSGIKSIFPFVRTSVADYITEHHLYL